MWKLTGRTSRHRPSARLIRQTSSLPASPSSRLKYLPSRRSPESIQRILEPILSSDIYLPSSISPATDFLGDIDSLSPYEATTGLIRSDGLDEGTRFSEKRVIGFHEQLKAVALKSNWSVQDPKPRPLPIEQAHPDTSKVPLRLSKPNASSNSNLASSTELISHPPPPATLPLYTSPLTPLQDTSVTLSQSSPIKSPQRMIQSPAKSTGASNPTSKIKPEPEPKLKHIPEPKPELKPKPMAESPGQLQPTLEDETPPILPMVSTSSHPTTPPSSSSLIHPPPKPSTSISASCSLPVTNPKLVKAMAPTYSGNKQKPPNFLLPLKPRTPVAPMTNAQSRLVKLRAVALSKSTPSRKKVLKVWNSHRRPEKSFDGSFFRRSGSGTLSKDADSENKFSSENLGVSLGRLDSPPTSAVRKLFNSSNAPVQSVPLPSSSNTRLVFDNPHDALSSVLLDHLVRETRRLKSPISSAYAQYCIDTLNQSLGQLESITLRNPFSSFSRADPKLLRQYLHQYLLTPAFHTQARQEVLDRLFNLGLQPSIDLEILTLRALFLRQKTYLREFAPYSLFIEELLSLQTYFDDILSRSDTHGRSNIPPEQVTIDRRRVWSTVYFGFRSMSKNPIPTNLKTQLLAEARKEPVDQTLISKLSGGDGNGKSSNDERQTMIPTERDDQIK